MITHKLINWRLLPTVGTRGMEDGLKNSSVFRDREEVEKKEEEEVGKG